MVFITELRLCFLATQQQTNSDKKQVDESQHISNHSRYYKLWQNGRFLYSVHVIAFRTAGLQNLRASPPVSTFGPSDTVTRENLRGRFHSGSSTAEPKSA